MKSKLLVFIITFGICVGVLFAYADSHIVKHIARQVMSAQTSAQQIIKVSPAPLPGIPVNISIPSIKVNAKVESVGMDSQGRMDVPKVADDTAWYSPGFKPGTSGSAVIDGHYDRVTGAPAVFWDLKKLTVGDTITITDNNSRTFTFAVTRLVKYPDSNFPIKEVFSASDVPMLNLITCNGVWDKAAKNYSERLVVYSKLISEK